jgi:dihydrofolate synthase/folylpolyglutamate synthase
VRRLVPAAEGIQCAIAPAADGRWIIEAETATRRYGAIRLGLAGEHQIGNALVAIRILEALDDAGVQSDATHAAIGLAEVDWPGRLELIRLEGGRSVLVDAAHNPAGAQAFARELRRLYPSGVPLVVGVSADKDASQMLQAFAPAASHLIVTDYAGRRRLPASDLAALAEPLAPGRVSIRSPLRTALEAALAMSPAIALSGSIFLVGEARGLLASGDGRQAPAAV